MDKKEVILQVTLDMIKEEGFDKITIRKIAKAARVNIAMINYYFGSKENLMSQAIAVILENIKDAFKLLDETQKPPVIRLRGFLTQYAITCLQNPGAFRQFIQRGIFDYDSQKDFFLFLKSFGFHKVMDVIGEITGETDEERQIMIMLQIMGGIIFPTVMITPISLIMEFDVKNIEQKVEPYLEILLNKYI